MLNRTPDIYIYIYSNWPTSLQLVLPKCYLHTVIRNKMFGNVTRTLREIEVIYSTSNLTYVSFIGCGGCRS